MVTILIPDAEIVRKKRENARIYKCKNLIFFWNQGVVSFSYR